MTPITKARNFTKNSDLTTKNRSGQSYYDLFLHLAHEAENSNDKLNENYKNISNDWKNYRCFTVVFAPIAPFTMNPKYEAVAFSGLQTDRFDNKIGRALTRTYYAKSVRKENLSPRKLPNLASRYMLPKQYEYAQKHNLNHIFISFESTLVRKKFTTLFTKMLNKTYNEYTSPFSWKPDSWKELDGLYYTGVMDGIIREQCWQHIVLYSFNDMPFNLYRKNYE